MGDAGLSEGLWEGGYFGNPDDVLVGALLWRHASFEGDLFTYILACYFVESGGVGGGGVYAGGSGGGVGTRSSTGVGEPGAEGPGAEGPGAEGPGDWKIGDRPFLKVSARCRWISRRF